MVAPHHAETAQDLWQVLLTSRPRGDTVPLGVASLLTKHHGQGQPRALATALLVCTCRRWERCAGALIRDIVDEGVLSEGDLDRLARLFLLGDTIPFRKPGGRRTVQLQVHTPLQRWAAGYLLRRWPERFTSLLDQARSSKAATGSAMVNGMLDSIGALGPDEAALLLDFRLVWSLGSVRPHALEIFVAQGGVEEAARRAATDPDAKMRHWNPRRPASPVADPAKGTGLQDSLVDGGIV